MTILSTGVATEFINFTRASNATVVDSNGLIDWAAHNLLTNSESFDAAAWAKTTLTVAANADVAPNSTTTADTLTAGGANSTILQTYTAEAVPYTYGVWLRRKTGTGTIQIAADSGTWNTVTITSSWALYTISQTPTAGSKTAGIRIVTSADEVYAWGAHLYRSDMGMQANTSAYPMYNPTTPKNLLGFTEDFSNWAKTVSGDTITINAATAPNGLQTADLWVADGTSANHRLDQTVSVQPTTGTYSFYVKLQTASAFVQISQSGNNAGWVNFDLVNGTKSDQGTGMTGSITSVGNGWYRCSAYNTNSPSANLRLSLVTGLTAARIETAAISSGIYLWGAQLSDSASLDTYSPVYGAAVTSAAYYGPRRDFDSAGVCKGLLVEEQRTNSLLHSAAFDVSATWTDLIAGTGTNAVRTANAGVSPDGTSTADRLQLTLNGGTTTNDAVRIRQSATPSAGAATFSVWLKSYDGVSTYTMALGAVGSQAITVTGQWQRFVFSFTATGSATGFDIFIRGGQVPAHSNSVDVLAWGAQLEAGSFATSYIPTGAATATRSADVASVSTQAFPYSETEGTIVVNASSPCVAAIANMITLDNGTTQERIRLLTDVASVKTIVTESNTTQANLSPDSATANTPFKFAVAFKVNDFAAVVNGSAAATDAAGNVPVVNIARLGADSSGNYLNGHIRQITYLPRRISNTELQTRTT